MLSAPRLTDEALRELDRNPPKFVVLEGIPSLASLDGVPNRDRIPAIVLWVEANYPNRLRVGRYVIAQPR
jgi:hypothetical protein